MSNFRAALTFAIAGTLLGIIVGSLIAPSILTGSMCGFTNDVQLNRPCIDTVQQATAGLVRYQLYGGVVGTVVGLAAGIFFSVKRKKPAAAASTVDASAPKA